MTHEELVELLKCQPEEVKQTLLNLIAEVEHLRTENTNLKARFDTLTAKVTPVRAPISGVLSVGGLARE